MAGAACQATIGEAGLSGRTACTDATAAVLTARLFNLAMVGLGLAFLCSSIPACIGTAVELCHAITTQGSSGPVTQPIGDPRDAVEDHPSPPPIPIPGQVGSTPPSSLDQFPNAEKKFDQHGDEFGFTSLEEYVREAIAIAGGAIVGGKGPGRGESCKASNGTVYVWDYLTGGIVTVSRFGFIVNYFRPPEGISYWYRQCET